MKLLHSLNAVEDLSRSCTKKRYKNPFSQYSASKLSPQRGARGRKPPGGRCHPPGLSFHGPGLTGRRSLAGAEPHPHSTRRRSSLPARQAPSRRRAAPPLLRAGGCRFTRGFAAPGPRALLRASAPSSAPLRCTAGLRRTAGLAAGSQWPQEAPPLCEPAGRAGGRAGGKPESG